MLGAIAGDIIGSVYEFGGTKREDFELFSGPFSTFTDDTVLTCATADAILNGQGYADKYRDYYRLYPEKGYGGNFKRWALTEETKPYNSFGNGSAMRVSPVAWAFESLEEVLDEAKRSAEVTHNHIEGIKGAMAVACAIFMARKGKSKEKIKKGIEEGFEYFLDFDLEKLREEYTFDVTCQGSVPQAIFCFLISKDFEDAVRKAVSLGGDCDTIACITGSIAEAFYGGVPEDIKKEVILRLDWRLADIAGRFINKYMRSFIRGSRE